MRHGKSGGCTKEFDIGRRIFRWDKANLDIFWLKDESLEDSANLPDPDIIAAEIDSRFPNRSPSGPPVHVVRSRDLHCRRPPSRVSTVRRNRG